MHTTFAPTGTKERPRQFSDFAVFGEVLDSPVEYWDNVSDITARLNPNSCWQIGMDQSTSNCGVFIKNLDNTETYMMEFHRKRGQDADDFMFQLERGLHLMCQYVKASHLIYEKPIDTGSYRSAQVLFQLEGYIRGLVKRYDEFMDAKLDNVANSSWRAEVVLPKYQGLERKRASYMSIREIFPWVNAYGESLGPDQDIFEAMGVLFGWYMTAFDPLGRPYARKEKFNGNIGGFYLPDVSAVDVSKEFSKLGLDTDWYVYNGKASLWSNIASAVEKQKVTCLEIGASYQMLLMCVESNMVWTNPEKITLVLVASNFVDRNLFKVTGDKYHFVL